MCLLKMPGQLAENAKAENLPNYKLNFKLTTKNGNMSKLVENS